MCQSLFWIKLYNLGFQLSRKWDSDTGILRFGRFNSVLNAILNHFITFATHISYLKYAKMNLLVHKQFAEASLSVKNHSCNIACGNNNVCKIITSCSFLTNCRRQGAGMQKAEWKFFHSSLRLLEGGRLFGTFLFEFYPLQQYIT